MPWQSHRSHTEQIETLRRAIRNGRLPHAMLFLGPAGIGKRHFAKLFAQCLFCERSADEELRACGECSGCRQLLAGSHPDFLQIGLQSGSSELLIEQIIGPAERRGKEGFLHEFALRPMAHGDQVVWGGRKVAIIDAADRMNEETANSLLKTLEEPPDRAVLMLIGSTEEAILPTIRSRVQVLYFAPLSEEDTQILLLEQHSDLSAIRAREIAGLSEGSLETASQLLEADLVSMREEITRSLSAEDFSPVALAARMQELIEATGKDTPTQRRAAIWMLRFVIECFRPQLREEPPTAALAAKAIDLAADHTQFIEGYSPVPLVVEAFFSSLWQQRTAAVGAAG